MGEMGRCRREPAAQGNWKATKRESWTYSRARLVELVGDRPLGSIHLLTLQALRQALSERYSRATVVLTMSYAGAVRRAASTTGRIGRDPTRGLLSAKARASGARRQGRTR